MSFKSLNRILDSLQADSGWQEQPLQQILKHWQEAVGAAVASHTQPRSIQRDVLSVATSSAVWAQELTFGRQRLLVKLNTYLSVPLVDIRFSTAQWRHKENKTAASKQSSNNLWREHPSYLVDAPNLPKTNQTPNSPNAAFQHWVRMTQARSHGLPLCPQCYCPTPVGELQRWDVCAICINKKGVDRGRL